MIDLKVLPVFYKVHADQRQKCWFYKCHLQFIFSILFPLSKFSENSFFPCTFLSSSSIHFPSSYNKYGFNMEFSVLNKTRNVELKNTFWLPTALPLTILLIFFWPTFHPFKILSFMTSCVYRTTKSRQRCLWGIKHVSALPLGSTLHCDIHSELPKVK